MLRTGRTRGDQLSAYDDRADAYRCRLHDRHNDGHDPCSLRAADAIPNSRRKAVRVSAAGLLKVCTPIYRGDSGGRRSQIALMPLGAGIRERCARDRSPPGPRHRRAARFTRARRAGLPARAPHFALRKIRCTYILKKRAMCGHMSMEGDDANHAQPALSISCCRRRMAASHRISFRPPASCSLSCL